MGWRPSCVVRLHLLLKNYRVFLDQISCAASVGFEFGPKTGLAPVEFPLKKIKIGGFFSVIGVTFQKTIVGERIHVRNDKRTDAYK